MLSSNNLLLGSTVDHLMSPGEPVPLSNLLITYSLTMLLMLSYVIKVTLLSSSSLLETRSNTSGSEPQAGSTLPNATNFVMPAGGSSDSVTIMSNVPSDDCTHFHEYLPEKSTDSPVGMPSALSSSLFESSIAPVSPITEKGKE